MELKGLSTITAKEKLTQFGLNQLPSKKTYSIFKLIISQFSNFLIWLLIIAALLAYYVGETLDAVLILIVLIFNIALGFWQEFKASKELEALRKLEVSTSRVIRDGTQSEISSLELVPGDIVVLESGDKIPADGKVIESFDLSVNESALTGESLPVVKNEKKDENLVYFSSIVSSGRCKIEITETGTKTKFGKIALTLASVPEEPTPLEVSLNDLAKRTGILAVAVAIIIFLVRFTQGYDLIELIPSSIALMVAAVPEGLPAVITVLLALGVRRMYKKKTLVRKLSSIESLGATSIICTDKTGTLTKNEMSVRQVFTNKKLMDDMIKTAVLCNSSSLVEKENHGSKDVLGDTTEGALLFWAEEHKVNVEDLRKESKIVEEAPFNLKTRMMSVLAEDLPAGRQGNKKFTLYSKGAPEAILPICKLTPKKQKELIGIYQAMAKKGLRVLALAQKPMPKGKDHIEKEKNLEFLGLVGIADSPRPEAKVAIEKARSAGIMTVMITGDNELTAKAIAEEVGLLKEGDEILTGEQLDKLSDEELKNSLEKVRVFARVVPEHKLKIVKAYQDIGHIVAVTGDGVNDALALKQAHVGVAMGQTGTDVAKEAGDLIILDDNLATIVDAVEEGRTIYNNILKTVKFLMTGNLSEVLVILVAALSGLPTPFTATQILWINFVSDGFPALSLAADEPSSNVMKNSPRQKSEMILNMKTFKFIVSFGVLIATICIAAFIISLNTVGPKLATSITFSVMVFAQMIFVLLMRRHHSLTSNKYLLLSVSIAILLQINYLFLVFNQ